MCEVLVRGTSWPCNSFFCYVQTVLWLSGTHRDTDCSVASEEVDDMQIFNASAPRSVDCCSVDTLPDVPGGGAKRTLCDITSGNEEGSGITPSFSKRNTLHAMAFCKARFGTVAIARYAGGIAGVLKRIITRIFRPTVALNEYR